MKLINNSPRNYIAYDTILETGKIIEIKDKLIIDIFLKQEGIEEYIDKNEVEKLKKEIKELKAEKEAKKEVKIKEKATKEENK